jgi:membrane-bound lytic murein transglycosylase MltF
MIIAQGYQESGLDQEVKSHAGAIGIMQMLPSTAASKEVGIRDISTAENNIHAGVKYMHWLRNRHFAEDDLDPQNQTLLVLASYNSGATRVKRLRHEAAARGLNPNVWFQNVEVIAAEQIGRETVQYVRTIYKYYVAYRLVMEQEIRKTQITSDNDNRP